MSHVNTTDHSTPQRRWALTSQIAAFLGFGQAARQSAPRALPPRPAHQRLPQARERARRVGGPVWEAFKAADRARRGLQAEG